MSMFKRAKAVSKPQPLENVVSGSSNTSINNTSADSVQWDRFPNLLQHTESFTVPSSLVYFTSSWGSVLFNHNSGLALKLFVAGCGGKGFLSISESQGVALGVYNKFNRHLVPFINGGPRAQFAATQKVHVRLTAFTYDDSFGPGKLEVNGVVLPNSSHSSIAFEFDEESDTVFIRNISFEFILLALSSVNDGVADD